MRLVWDEDGEGSLGEAPNPFLWGFKKTDQWQPSNELQYYTDSTTNAYYNGQGQLILKAIKEPVGGKQYSSARLTIKDSTTPEFFLNGMISARIKVPTGVGIWPAFWLLGEDNYYGWPWCGEIDILESPVIAGQTIKANQGTHSPSSTGADISLGVTPNTFTISDYHTYSVLWQKDSVEFFLDHKSTGIVTKSSVQTAGGIWQFNHRPQSIILNLAVGGWAGTPDPNWTSQTMSVDWVRVYE